MGTTCTTNRFTWLPTGGDTVPVYVYGITGDGSTVVGTILAANYYYGTLGVPWLWTQSGGVSTYTTQDREYAYAYGVSNNGHVVAGYSGFGNTPPAATEWLGGTETLLDGSSSLGENSQAFGVSGDGNTVVGFDPSLMPTKWVSGNATELLSGAHDSHGAATGTNGNGTVIVGYWASDPFADPTTFAPFKWTQLGGTQPLAMGIYSYGTAQAVSSDGNVAVGGVAGYPARWVTSGSAALLGTTVGTAYAASQDGSTIVGTTQINGSPQTGTPTSSVQQAFIWTSANGFMLLQSAVSTAPSGNIMYATGVSADGKTVVGYGVASSGSYQGWMAKLP